MNKANLYQIQVGLFQAHVDDCRECKAAIFSGRFCNKGIEINAELEMFFDLIDLTRRVA